MRYPLDDGPIVRECTVTQLVLANLHHVVEQRRLQNCLYPMRLSGEGGIALLQQGGASRFQVSAALRPRMLKPLASMRSSRSICILGGAAPPTVIKRVRTRLVLSLDKAVVCVGHCGAADLDIGIVPVSFWMTRRLTSKIDPLNERLFWWWR